MRMTQRSSRDYVDERLILAAERAAEILVERMNEWKDTIDAYWLLRRYEDRIGVPVTYDIVEQAVEKARRVLEATGQSISHVKV